MLITSKFIDAFGDHCDYGRPKKPSPNNVLSMVMLAPPCWKFCELLGFSLGFHLFGSLFNFVPDGVDILKGFALGAVPSSRGLFGGFF